MKLRPSAKTQPIFHFSHQGLQLESQKPLKNGLPFQNRRGWQSRQRPGVRFPVLEMHTARDPSRRPPRQALEHQGAHDALKIWGGGGVMDTGWAKGAPGANLS